METILNIGKPLTWELNNVNLHLNMVGATLLCQEHNRRGNETEPVVFSCSDAFRNTLLVHNSIYTLNDDILGTSRGVW